jgi:hypothetical protein
VFCGGIGGGHPFSEKVRLVEQILEPLWQIFINLRLLLIALLAQVWVALPLLAWFAWWLWAVNWSKAWEVLAEGAWMGLVLAMILVALVWSQLAPSECACLGFATVPNFWWQLGGVSLLVVATLLCGLFQITFHWEPTEINLEPSEPAGHTDGHGHH